MPEPAGKPVLNAGVLRLLGYVGAGFIVWDLASKRLDPGPQLPHLAIFIAIAFQLVPRVFSSLLSIYISYAIHEGTIPQGHSLMPAWWCFCRAALGIGALNFIGTCFNAEERSSAAHSFARGALAIGFMVVCIEVLTLSFVSEDVFLLRFDPLTEVETPAARTSLCGTADGLRQLCRGSEQEEGDAEGNASCPAACVRLEVLSWDAAEAKADAALANMTSEERRSLLVGVGWKRIPKIANFLPLDAIPKRGYYMGNTMPIPRLGFPALKYHDAGNGFRNSPWPGGVTGSSTCWPSSLALGATWDDGLVERVAAAMGREYRGKGANVILGPGIQVHRVSKAGRNWEYMSGEDPYLGARLAAAFVRGVQNEGVIACVKHWAFNDQETLRTVQSSDVAERTAWELYYPPFEAAVAAGAGSVMCSYNRVNGTYACANSDLLRRDLKEKMGFRGFVVSDWWALTSTANGTGFDQEMPGAGAHHTPDMLEAWEKDDKTHDWMQDAVRRILAAAYRMRVPDRPSCTPGRDCINWIYSDQRSEAHVALAREAATQAIVLLKNDGILPIGGPGAGVKSIALIGQALGGQSRGSLDSAQGADYYMGGGSGHCQASNSNLTTPLQGLSRRAEELGMTVVTSLSDDVLEAVETARGADVAIVLAATTAREGEDRFTLILDYPVNDIIMAVAKERPTAVLVQAPGAVLLPFRDEVSALAMVFLAGEETGNAWASAVFGDASPSGKLPIMLHRTTVGQVEMVYQLNNGYSEGLFTSYRSDSAASDAAYPFGHGLSYAEFEYDKPKLVPSKKCAELACIQVVVTNTGARRFPGAEVAQAYVQFPAEANEPRLVLRGFRRTAVLKHGERETVVFNLTVRDLSIYQGEWQLQRNVTVHIGSSSADIRHSIHVKVPKPPAARG